MGTKRIAAKWADYRERVVPVDAPPVQVRETQMAFYAGAAALFDTVMNGLSPEPDATDSDIGMMDEIMRELTEFGASVAREGRS